ncbi:type II toxin-antitoxin system Phd/YefM family antitoxin [Streptomyces sp. TRM 70361]|uniref:type II toxin-antitoxin system Phd/YefM family antitoxin n=1 Tax=Streptomyces sp. TRM 70361 TaxID=3116553 RepID=UPI002E7C5400|nr:type II toxin-antitoxin system Phd/YefM family antitoxin [Streptomyces sp. TRM 70361]MEE1942890.1 type II toxin-antitoxin system Phd/YefM family antitoxin [Streptomyces sp. TRM 70361]
MSDTIGVDEARAGLHGLVRRAAVRGERIVPTEHGQVAAVLISPQELADLEDGLALARYEPEKATGTVDTVSHDQVVSEARGEARSRAA